MTDNEAFSKRWEAQRKAVAEAMARRQASPHTVYALRCKPNGKVYIGVTTDLGKRFYDHIRTMSSAIRRATDHPEILKNPHRYLYINDAVEYGHDAFELWVLEEDIPWEKARAREDHYILLYRSNEEKYGYNRRLSKTVPPIPDARYGLPPNLAKEGEQNS